MKRLRYMIVSIVCLISGVLILFSSLRVNKELTGKFQVVYNYTGNERLPDYKGAKEVRSVDGLPKNAQIPGDKELAGLDETKLLLIYWKYINMLQILCKDVIRVGNLKDGGKEICVDPGYKPEAPCLVYSFGINNLFDFDNDIINRFGCDVHCFDPSMKNETRQLSKHMWFYRWGLGGRNGVNSKGWAIKTLDTIRKELGHTNRTIDLLKIDIEGDEWISIPQMISSGALDDVRQISMETHFLSEHPNQKDYWGELPPNKQLSSLRQLYDFGYRTFMRERNMWSHTMWRGIKGFLTNVNEISMIKPKR